MSKWIGGGEVQLNLGDSVVLEDVDLDKEIVIVDGERLTKARAEQISEEIMEAVYKHYGMKFVPRKLNG
jgi:hypothetical protein